MPTALFEYDLNALEKLPWVSYGDTGTKAYYDRETDTYYNNAGCELRDPAEYDPYSEGYTPFGDE